MRDVNILGIQNFQMIFRVYERVTKYAAFKAYQMKTKRIHAKSIIDRLATHTK